MAETVDYAALKAGGFMHQKQKGFFSLRVQTVGGNMTAENIKVISEVAERYGHGYVHMTSRQGIEIPFINIKDIETVKTELAKGGVKPGVCGPRVRTVTACQGSAICPNGCIDTLPIAVELDKRYFGRTLPHKFKFGVTGCRANCLKAEENDFGVKGGMDVQLDKAKCKKCGVCVKACPFDAWSGESGYIVSFGGLFGNEISKGMNLLPIIKDKETLFRVADAAINFFAENAKPSERFRVCLERIGLDTFKKVVQAAYDGEAAGS